MSTNLPPPPINDMREFPHSVQEWLRKLWIALGGATPTGIIPWTQINKSGANLTDIPTRNHNDLQNKQGGSGTEFYHLTNAQNQLLSANQSANTVLSGPITGAAATPTYKQLRSTTWKDADTSRNGTVTLADDPDLIFAIGANDKWIGRCFIDAGVALKTTGIKLTIAGPTGSSGNIHVSVVTDSTTAQEAFVANSNTLGAAIDFTAGSFAASATQAYIEIAWRVANGANAGNISFQWAQSTNVGTNLTLGAGSQMTADRVA